MSHVVLDTERSTVVSYVEQSHVVSDEVQYHLYSDVELSLVVCNVEKLM